MDLSGRTQRSDPGSLEASPQRMDLGQGNSRMMAGMASAMICTASRPGFRTTAT